MYLHIYRMIHAAVRTENTKQKKVVFWQGQNARDQRREKAVRKTTILEVRRCKSEAKSNLKRTKMES
jgi:hypothetical protein